MKTCSDCRHLKRKLIKREEFTTDFSGKLLQVTPEVILSYCTLSPEWVEIVDPYDHYCSFCR
jgi:hypothetical protein